MLAEVQNLTLTSVVFEFLKSFSKVSILPHLTLTSVVFECFNVII